MMGLSGDQVSGDGVDWGQALLEAASVEAQKDRPIKRKVQPRSQIQHQEQLKCPRCDSTNTKFCYYNNYNKSQPRHFCKSCKRHWTEGGTLRNVPIGGGRKNKRRKTSSSTTPTGSESASISPKTINQMQVYSQQQQQGQRFPLTPGNDEKRISEILLRSLIHPQSSLQHGFISGKNFCSSINQSFLSSFSFPNQSQNLHIPLTLPSSCSFDSNPSSVSSPFQSSSAYNYSGGPETTTEDLSSSSLMPTANNATNQQPWQPPTASGLVKGSYWGLDDDIDALVSADLNLSWDDPEVIKP